MNVTKRMETIGGMKRFVQIHIRLLNERME
jgi:hypothetical protein